jgi:hypothetical protein
VHIATEIAKCDIPTGKKIVWGHGEVSQQKGGTPYRSSGKVKSQNIDIRIRDPTKSEIPTR